MRKRLPPGAKPKKRETRGAKLAAQARALKKEKKEKNGPRQNRVAKDEEESLKKVMVGAAIFMCLFIGGLLIYSLLSDKAEKKKTDEEKSKVEYDESLVWQGLLAFLAVIIIAFAGPLLWGNVKRWKEDRDKKQKEHEDSIKEEEIRKKKIKENLASRSRKVTAKQSEIERAAESRMKSAQDAQFFAKLRDQSIKEAEEKRQQAEALEAAAKQEQQQEFDLWQKLMDAQRAEREKRREIAYQEAMKHWYSSKKARREEEAAKNRKAASEQEQHEINELWGNSQQRSLDKALADLPASSFTSSHERWAAIAAKVPKKDLMQCVNRYKEVRRSLRQQARAEQKEYWSMVEQMGGDVPEGVKEGFEEGGSDSEDSLDILSDEDESEDDEEQADEDRLPVELEPAQRGTCISLGGMQLGNIDTARVDRLALQLSCLRCQHPADITLSGLRKSESETRVWCEKCSALLEVKLRPTLLTSTSSVLGHVDMRNCCVIDVLPSNLVGVCGKADCSHENAMPAFQRERRCEGNCFACHARYQFFCSAINVEELTAADCSGGDTAEAKREKGLARGGDPRLAEIQDELKRLRKKAKGDPRQAAIKVGSSLPQMGACRHFRQSYRWLRYSCCGKAFPCPTCHADSGCPAAPLGQFASRMICGKCSFEQPFSSRACGKCGYAMGQRSGGRSTGHWQGGTGSRNRAMLSNKESRKFKGGQKADVAKSKTKSKKAGRVGQAAKKARDRSSK